VRSTKPSPFEKMLVWDNHVCLPHDPHEKWMHELLRHKNAGVNMLLLSVAGSDIETLETLFRMTAFYRDWITNHPDDFCLVLTAQDVRNAKINNKLGIAFDVEAPKAMGEQLSLLGMYHDLGIRWMVMAYNANNQIAGGCHGEDPGLSSFGYRLIEEMDRVGIVKCCTHTGYRSAMDVLKHSNKPVIFSHSNPRALWDHPRNIPNELIDACAETGGVVCINGVGIFLGDNDISCETMSRHIDYVVQRIGINHVGIGTDYTYDTADLDGELESARHIWPKNLGYEPGIKFFPPEDLPKLGNELLRLGYSEQDMGKIFGENLLRVAEQVW